jgi:hypothetical protein
MREADKLIQAESHKADHKGNVRPISGDNQVFFSVPYLIT